MFSATTLDVLMLVSEPTDLNFIQENLIRIVLRITNNEIFVVSFTARRTRVDPEGI